MKPFQGCEAQKEYFFKDGKYLARGIIIRNMTYGEETSVVDIFWERGELERMPITFLEILGRPITLADVLRTIEKGRSTHASRQFKAYLVSGGGDSWNLSEDLSGQSPETIDFLAMLFKHI